MTPNNYYTVLTALPVFLLYFVNFDQIFFTCFIGWYQWLEAKLLVYGNVSLQFIEDYQFSHFSDTKEAGADLRISLDYPPSFK